MSNLNKTVDIHKIYNVVCAAQVYQATAYSLVQHHAHSQPSYIPTCFGGGQHHLPQERQHYRPKKSLLEAVYLVTRTSLYFAYPINTPPAVSQTAVFSCGLYLFNLSFFFPFWFVSFFVPSDIDALSERIFICFELGLFFCFLASAESGL